MLTRQMHGPNFITLQTFFFGVGIFFSVSVVYKEKLAQHVPFID